MKRFPQHSPVRAVVAVLGWMTAVAAAGSAFWVPASEAAAATNANENAVPALKPLDVPISGTDYGGPVDFLSKGAGMSVLVGYNEVLLLLQRPQIPADEQNAPPCMSRGQELKIDALQPQVAVRMRIEDQSAAARAYDGYGIGSRDHYFLGNDPRQWLKETPSYAGAHYANIYPGVDMAYYGDQTHLEYAFTVWPGADPSQIHFTFEGTDEIVPEKDGSLALYFAGGKLVEGTPVFYKIVDGVPQPVSGRYTVRDKDIGFQFESPATAPKASDFGPGDMALVPGGGQPHGPDYDFYVSKFEVANAEFVRFLNDAQASAGDARGTNMVFDFRGNVWFNPSMVPNRHEMFQIAHSRLVYQRDAPVGKRYSIVPATTPEGGSYSNYPIVGVSWYGAVKYCNWLTVANGRGAQACCYREGTNAVDWAPATSSPTNWSRGYFSESERRSWLSVTGFRLLMDDCSGTNVHANTFNEFYKVAAWTGTSNALYGFGRSFVIPGDANAKGVVPLPTPHTTPVGFFNGTNQIASVRTRTNENLFGVFDLSGNAGQWLNDPGETNSLAYRACGGGSCATPLAPLTERRFYKPSFTDKFGGFRVATTASSDPMYLVRVPYRVFLCPYRLAAETQKPAEIVAGTEKGAKLPEEEVFPGLTLNLAGKRSEGWTEGWGVIYQTFPYSPPVPVRPSGPSGGGGGGGGGGVTGGEVSSSSL